METREEIERLVDEIYAARQREDLEAIVGSFHDNARFAINGGEGVATDRAQHRSAIGGLLEAFALLEFRRLCYVIDPPRAVVHWRGKFRSKNGQVADTEVLDLIEIRDGRIASLTTFFDTALAARLMA